MGLFDSILEAGGANAIGQMAKQLGIPDSVAKQAASALAPALSKGIERNVSKPGGLDSLLGALGGGQHQQYVDEPQTVSQPTSIEDGNVILGHILGSKDVSRNVAANAGAETGISADVLKKMLPMLGTVAMGALSKQAASGGTSALTSILDSDKDGSPADDIFDLAKKLF